MKVITFGTFAILILAVLALGKKQPDVKEIAAKFCNCGSKLAKVVQTEAALKQKDAYLYQQKLSAASKEMLGCLGGMAYLEQIGENLDKNQQKSLELELMRELESQCPQVAKGLQEVK